MSHGHCVRPAQWDSLGDVAARDGLRLRDELLATTARPAAAWYLAIAPFRFAGLAGPLRADRLVTGRRGWKFRASSFWGLQTGPNPTDRAKLGSKRHVVRDGHGVPLAIQLTGANRNDSQQALALVDAIPSLQGKRGHPRHCPDRLLGDRGYDAEAIRQGLRARRIVPLLAKRNTENGSGLGPMAMGCRADFRLVESVPAAASSLRKAGGHSRGISIPGMCSDLLALSANSLGVGLKQPSFHCPGSFRMDSTLARHRLKFKRAWCTGR